MVYVHAHTRSTPPQRLRCPPRSGARHVHHRLRHHIFAFSATCKISAVGSLFAHPSVTEREFEVGFVLQQHRAGASDTLASSPPKRENQVLVHCTLGALSVSLQP